MEKSVRVYDDNSQAIGSQQNAFVINLPKLDTHT